MKLPRHLFLRVATILTGSLVAVDGDENRGRKRRKSTETGLGRQLRCTHAKGARSAMMGARKQSARSRRKVSSRQIAVTENPRLYFD